MVGRAICKFGEYFPAGKQWDNTCKVESYNGRNHNASDAGYLATQLARIRQSIFHSKDGTIPGSSSVCSCKPILILCPLSIPQDIYPLPSAAGAYGTLTTCFFNKPVVV